MKKNGKYDYSKFVYVNSDTKGIIICPEHGEFLITPYHHLNRKHGCSKCSNRNLYTLEYCKKDALKYKTRNEWQKKSKGAYRKAHRNGWLDVCCKHMKPAERKKKYTLNLCKENALKYKTRKEWSTKETGFYDAAIRNGWLDVCCKHMVSGRKRGVKT